MGRSINSVTEFTTAIEGACLVSTKKIRPDPRQIRWAMHPKTIEELASSIKEYSIINPITVEYIEEEDFYKIVSGERRFRAAVKAGMSYVPCIVKDHLPLSQRYAYQLVENIHREDLNPVDRAVGLLNYKALLGPKTPWVIVEKKLGISETRRKQLLALLNLPEKIQREIVTIEEKKRQKAIVTEKHARALLMLNQIPEKQWELFTTIKTASVPISGDRAIEMAKGIMGEQRVKVFRLSYRTTRELIKKLEEKLHELYTSLGN